MGSFFEKRLERNARGALRRARWVLAIGCLVSLVPVVVALHTNIFLLS